ncbi:isocitrate/isopropylmalate dehydrogenase family protein [bacterium]|nr:isocitrate/isopropylmalate dehydrogenase family protein [bacterium]HPF36503.1 isocitrate/isopropylmalate dehydrogenase family protein [Candidatus Krumholzibacteria bacterium]HRX52184.1 isocitrate/isopropylmalate dehydrogenase family protein [Candidatus Krumholzibacteria bacterium]
MAKYRIGWMPGDGVGVDVMDATKVVLDKLGFDAEYVHGDIGWEIWRTEANPLPDRTIAMLKDVDAALFGAITSKPKEEAEAELAPELRGQGHVYRSPIVRLRQEFDLTTNLRPCKAYTGNPLNFKDGLDLVVFRQNTEGLYMGVEYHPLPQDVREKLTETHPAQMKRLAATANEDIAISTRIFTRKGCQDIVREAFEYAKKFGYKTVTVVEKPNVVRETSGLMVREARKIAQEFPGIELWETNIDAMCMWLVKNPQDYGVLVASNMFGDIISDLCAQLVGGLGFACSGNIGAKVAIFEPSHGSAPKYVGMNKVNPIAMILSAKMMLDHLGELDMAKRLEDAVAAVIAEGKVRTYDMGGSSTTTEMAEAIAAKC